MLDGLTRSSGFLSGGDDRGDNDDGNSDSGGGGGRGRGNCIGGNNGDGSSNVRRNYQSRKNDIAGDGEQRNKSNEKNDFNKEKLDSLKKATEFIFTELPLLHAYWGWRYMQIQCISNLFCSPDVHSLKSKMVNPFLDAIVDVDIRVRLLAARYVRSSLLS